MKQHVDKRFQSELEQLQADILRMGGIIEGMIAKSISSLTERKTDIAKSILADDHPVNALELDIHERCVALLALHQPAASDLRFITVGLRIATDLERIGDLAVNIAERTVELNELPQLKPYIDLPRMAEATQHMVKEALDAFVAHDAGRARRMCAIDDTVDDLNRKIFAEIEEMMQKDPQAVARGLRLILISRQLERIADHATNIAEEVIFMVKGEDIRHGGGEVPPPTN